MFLLVLYQSLLIKVSIIHLLERTKAPAHQILGFVEHTV
jgi:hypothetical protein